MPSTEASFGRRPDSRLAGRVAMVTGAGSGIGRATALAYAAAGATCYCLDRTGQETTTAAEAGADLGRAVNVDLSHEADLVAAVRSVIDAEGRVDILCNVAGIHGPRAPIGEYGLDDFDAVFSINTRAVFLMMRAVLPTMVAHGGGRIVNVASIGGRVSIAPFTAPYSASKAAVLALTQGVAAEYGPAGVRANAICPGPIRTPMSPDSPQQARIEALVPLRRRGQADEIAAAALFLSSEESSFVNGAALVVDGGYTVTFPSSDVRRSAID